MSPQSGLPHNNRVGDFDVFALPALMRATGKTLEQLLDDLANRSGLLGLSGHNDLRDIEAAAARGEAASVTALDVFVASVRHYLGAYLRACWAAPTRSCSPAASARTRRGCARPFAPTWTGSASRSTRCETARRRAKRRSTTLGSRVQIWIMPTNEELIVARQAKALLEGQ